MDKLIGVIKIILPVMMMVFLGMLCRKKSLLKKEGIEGLKSFVFYITLPFIQFKAFYNTPLDFGILVIIVVVFILCVAALLFGFLFKKIVKSGMHTTPFLMTGFEGGMIGYALFTLLFGSSKIASFAMVALGQELFVFSVFLSLLQPSADKKNNVKSIVARFLKTPVVIGMLTGIVFGTTGLGHLIYTSAAGDVVQNLLEFITVPTAAVILLVIGYELEFKRFDVRLTLSTIAARLLFMAAACALAITVINAIFPMQKELLWAFVLLFMLPPPFVIPIFVQDEKENNSVSAVLSVYTVVTLALFAVIAFNLA